jgi:hypothetical protein
LRRTRFGVGANYRGREVIGFRGGDTIASPTNPAVAVDDPAVDAYTTVYSKPYTTGTLTLGYRFKLKGATDVNVSLKVDNVFDYSEPRFYSTLLRPPSGNLNTAARVTVPGAFYYVNPRSYLFTVSLRH